MSEHRLELYNPDKHRDMLFAAAIVGTDTSCCNGGTRFIGYGDTKHGFGPACIVDLAGTESVYEPHVTWFPWVSPANMIVNFKWAMQDLSRTAEVMLVVGKKETSFFEHFVKKGILRKIGFINRLPEIEEVHLYQYERNSDVKGS